MMTTATMLLTRIAARSLQHTNNVTAGPEHAAGL